MCDIMGGGFGHRLRHLNSRFRTVLVEGKQKKEIFMVPLLTGVFSKLCHFNDSEKNVQGVKKLKRNEGKQKR